MERSAAARRAQVHHFRIGVDQFSGARDVAGFGGFKDVGFGLLSYLSVDGAGGGRRCRPEYEGASGVRHEAILDLRGDGNKTRRIIFVSARNGRFSLEIRRWVNGDDALNLTGFRGSTNILRG